MKIAVCRSAIADWDHHSVCRTPPQWHYNTMTYHWPVVDPCGVPHRWSWRNTSPRQSSPGKLPPLSTAELTRRTSLQSSLDCPCWSVTNPSTHFLNSVKSFKSISRLYPWTDEYKIWQWCTKYEPPRINGAGFFTFCFGAMEGGQKPLSKLQKENSAELNRRSSLQFSLDFPCYSKPRIYRIARYKISSDIFEIRYKWRYFNEIRPSETENKRKYEIRYKWRCFIEIRPSEAENKWEYEIRYKWRYFNEIRPSWPRPI